MGNERRPTVDGWNGGSVDGMVERAVAVLTMSKDGNTNQLIIHCVPKNVHLFIFQITLSKVNRF